MNRDYAFKTKFDNERIKIVAAGFESPLNDLVLCLKDEYGRSVEALLSKQDILILAKCVGINEGDLTQDT